MLDDSALFSNFMRMAFMFAINHGCVTAVLNLAVILIGKQAGSYQSGALYVMYTLTALLLSTPILSILGSRKGLIIGSATYCVYVISIPLAIAAGSSQGALYAIAIA